MSLSYTKLCTAAELVFLLFPKYVTGTHAHCCCLWKALFCSDSYSSSHNCVLSLLKKKKKKWKWKLLSHVQLFANPMDSLLYYYSFLRYLFSSARVQLPWVSCLSLIVSFLSHEKESMADGSSQAFYLTTSQTDLQCPFFFLWEDLLGQSKTQDNNMAAIGITGLCRGR